MAPTAACKFGSKCARAGCTFKHPTWISCGQLGSQRCRFGGECKNKQCGFAHPEQSESLLQNEHYLKGAPAQEQAPWIAGKKFGDKRCRHGSACANAKCGFAHPADWVHQLPQEPPPVEWIECGKFGSRHCRDGGVCRNAQCGFAHPSDWVHFHGTMTATDGSGAKPPRDERPTSQPNHPESPICQQVTAAPVGRPSSDEAPFMGPTDEELAWMAACINEVEGAAVYGANDGMLEGTADGMSMSAEEQAWLDMQMSGQMSCMSLEPSCMQPAWLPPTAEPPYTKGTAKQGQGQPPRPWPPSFIASAFPTKAAYDRWVSEGADEATLPT